MRLLDALHYSLVDKDQLDRIVITNMPWYMVHMLSCMRLIMQVENRSRLPFVIRRAAETALPMR